MTSGISKPRAAALLLGLSTAWTAQPSRAAPPDAATIVAGLKRDVPARTAYAEVRWSGLLDRPLILRGELQYLGPSKLGKRVEQPYRETMTVADGTATVQRGDRKPRSFALGQAPELEGFLRGFSALLGGDAEALQRDFALTASGGASGWQLQLKPRDARLARRIPAIEVDGANGEPRCFRTHEGDGDLAILLVGPLASETLSPRVGRAEVDALCRGAKKP